MTRDLYKTIAEKFPFLSIVVYGNNKEEYVGIIQNTDTITTSIYDLGQIVDATEKKLFLELGERWYYESNRMIPINVFLKDEWKLFSKVFKTLITKEVTIVHGPASSLSNLNPKKKRRSVIVLKRN